MRYFFFCLCRLDDVFVDFFFDDLMLFSELDGFLIGLVLSLELIMLGEWFMVIWGLDEGGILLFEDLFDM